MIHENVQQYYGKTLQKTEDLKTSACCTSSPPPPYLRQIMQQIHSDVAAKYYGCGLILPEALDGLRILDLGCGAGQDVYILSALVGEHGEIVGVDMTDEQLAVAERYKDYHAKQFKYNKSNVRFIKGTLEELDTLELEPNSFDLIVSNCVINLCTDKLRVLKHIYQLLKPGGEMYFSDVYADRRIGAALRQDPILYGECLSGAFYWNDFVNAAKSCGFLDPRLVCDTPIEVQNDELAAKLGPIRFYSASYRLFKLEALEPACEDYGQAVIYRGGITHHDSALILDKHHVIEKGKVFPVCGNTYRMLKDTRFVKYFDFLGSWDTHFGIFEGCGSNLPYDDETAASACC